MVGPRLLQSGMYPGEVEDVGVGPSGQRLHCSFDARKACSLYLDLSTADRVAGIEQVMNGRRGDGHELERIDDGFDARRSVFRLVVELARGRQQSARSIGEPSSLCKQRVE